MFVIELQKLVQGLHSIVVNVGTCAYLELILNERKKNRFSIVAEAATAYLHRRLSFCCFAKFLAIAGRGSERKVLEKVEGVINIDHTLEKL